MQEGGTSRTYTTPTPEIELVGEIGEGGKPSWSVLIEKQHLQGKSYFQLQLWYPLGDFLKHRLLGPIPRVPVSVVLG